MELWQDYMVVVTLGICLCVGYVLKHLIPAKCIDRWIPLILAVVGGAVNLWASAWQLTPQTLLEGMVSGLASTGMYESIHQMKKP